jgi:hypothetical protein
VLRKQVYLQDIDICLGGPASRRVKAHMQMFLFNKLQQHPPSLSMECFPL